MIIKNNYFQGTGREGLGRDPFKDMRNERHIYSKALGLVAALVLMLCCGEARAQHLAIKTNALMDVALVPNIGLEVVTGEHSSVDVSVFGSHKPYGLHCTLLGLQPEYRFWFNGRPMVREYVGFSALLTTYDIGLGKQVYNGDAAGIGITGGYAFMIGKRWNLELCGGFGALVFHQKQYHSGDNYDDYFVDEATKANAWGYKLFPIKLGVTFSYIIK